MKTVFKGVFILLFLLTSELKSQLSGNAFLSGQINNSGIKVKFNSHGGTAITDSAFTTNTGTYSINITSGVYDVVFSKSGYLISNYNNGNTILLTNTTVLNNVTLLPGNGIFVTGNVSGNWSNNNTYIVNSDITVPSGSTLTIQKGTTIKFNGNYSLLSNGVLIAVGDSLNPILFTSNKTLPVPGDWNRIELKNSGCIIKYCIIEYGTYPLYMNYACGPIITNNEIRLFTNCGAWISKANPVFSKNWIHNYYTNYWTIGMSMDSNPIFVVDCNTINDGSGYGIRIFSDAIVRNNIVHDIFGSQRGYGIECEQGNPLIQNNYVFNCNTGIEACTSSGGIGIIHPIITNNTILYCGDGIGVGTFDPFGAATIINNIIAKNGNGVRQGSSNDTILELSHNIFWNNSAFDLNNVTITGIGQIVGTNNQSNPIDSYYNMFQDPLFLGNTPPNLSSSSPCINAGKSIYSPDIGYNPSYSCSYQTIFVNELSKDKISCKIYPNPNNGSFKILFDNEISNGKIILINSLGQKVYEQKINEGTNDINAAGLFQGLYHYLLLQNNVPTNSGNVTIE